MWGPGGLWWRAVARGRMWDVGWWCGVWGVGCGVCVACGRVWCVGCGVSVVGCGVSVVGLLWGVGCLLWGVGCVGCGMRRGFRTHDATRLSSVLACSGPCCLWQVSEIHFNDGLMLRTKRTDDFAVAKIMGSKKLMGEEVRRLLGSFTRPPTLPGCFRPRPTRCTRFAPSHICN